MISPLLDVINILPNYVQNQNNVNQNEYYSTMATLFKSHAIKQSCKLNVQIGITGGKTHAMIKK